jgi:DNA repair protein RadD
MDAIELREYQVRAVRQVFDAWRAGHRSVVLVAPTGMGKRIVALWLMQYAAEAGRKVLFVGNRRLLINQAQADAEKFGLDHGIIMADAEGGNAGSTNQIASIQSLESWYFYESFSDIPTGRGLPPANLLIIDEGHQDVGRYRTLLGFYPDAKVLILTATPVGAEGKSLVPEPYETLVEPVKNSELIRIFRETGGPQGLLPVRVFAPSEPHLQGVTIDGKKEYNQTKLGRAVTSCTLAADVFREWEPYQDRATVCFVPGIPFGRSLVGQFNDRFGLGTANLIEARTKPGERDSILASVRDRQSSVLVSCDVLREGFDLPVLSCGIDLQPNAQLRTYWQKLGRIKRPAEGQGEAIWLDLAGNSWGFPHPDEDPEWPVGEEETTQEIIERRRKEKKDPEPIRCSKCSYVRAKGPTCPNCGHGGGENMRRIRMGDGTLVEVPARKQQARQVTAEERQLNKWKSRLFAAMHSGISYAQCAAIYRREHGENPQFGWPGTYPAHDLRWNGKPQTQHSKGSLMQAFEHYQEKNRESGSH